MSAGADRDGRPRFVGGIVDMGAYEFQGPGMGEFIPWLAQYGLPTDGSADFTDGDGDGHNNGQEWRAGTNPTNATSALRLLAPIRNGAQYLVQWWSVPGRRYTLERSTNLSASPAFLPLATGISADADTCAFTDTAPPAHGHCLYRVRVDE